MSKTDVVEQYSLWKDNATDNEDLIFELKSIEGNEFEITDRFYRELEFGTGGLRGVIGAGTNRMNYYTVRKATQGLTNYILKQQLSGASVVIGYDSRIKSDYFAKKTAEVFAGNGIKAFVFRTLIPTPIVSFATRKLGAVAGINITASHNPAKYNGYKVYGADGCQITDKAASEILSEIDEVAIFSDVKSTEFDAAVTNNEIVYVAEEIIERYYLAIKEQALHKNICKTAGLKVVYTPLNGAGNIPVRRILSDIGVEDVIVVPEQEKPDGNFPTCPFPNPEIKEALSKGLELCDKVKADLLLATDPDCDRVGIAVPDGNGKYILLSGNETGALLLEYIIRERIQFGTLPNNAIAIKTIVTTPLADKICSKYGVTLREVLTGFKYIGEQIGLLERSGEAGRFVFGLEESYGYLAGTYAHDKDAVVASMLICEMAACYRSKGISLFEVRENLYNEYGYYYNALETFSFEGASGMDKMRSIMTELRNDRPIEINGCKVTLYSDYKNRINTPLDLPESDVIALTLEDEAKIIIRPSGTESKLKIYYSTVGGSMLEAENLQKGYADCIVKCYYLRK